MLDSISDSSRFLV